MHSGNQLLRAAIILSAAGLIGLSAPGLASAQLGAAAPYGAMGNYGYYGGMGPYGWGPYSFGWGGFTTSGTGPAMPPAGAAPDPRYQILTARMVRAETVNDQLRRQQMAASWRERRRQALSVQARYDVNTGRPRAVPDRMPPKTMTLKERIEALFLPDGTLAWPVGLDSASPAARRQVEQAAMAALEEYRLEGRAEVADVTFARQKLGEFATPVLSRLAATDDPLSYQAAFDFFHRLDATLIDLADPPAPPSDELDGAASEEPGAP